MVKVTSGEDSSNLLMEAHVIVVIGLVRDDPGYRGFRERTRGIERGWGPKDKDIFHADEMLESEKIKARVGVMIKNAFLSLLKEQFGPLVDDVHTNRVDVFARPYHKLGIYDGTNDYVVKDVSMAHYDTNPQYLVAAGELAERVESAVKKYVHSLLPQRGRVI